MPMSAQTTAGPVAGEPSISESPRGASKWLLIVCCVAQFMVILDLSIVNVALPRIQTDLGFSSPDLQWVIDAYAITFAGFLMLGGRVADHFGQRRTFVFALLLFGVASLAGGLAPDQVTLVAARALQGFAGAFMAACSLAIITASFEPGPKLHKAVATWAAMNGLGGAAGVLFGGIITEFLSWRWVLLINPPVALAFALVGWAVITERKRASADDSFDLAGALTLTIGQMVLVFGVVEGGLKGWGSFDALGPIVTKTGIIVGMGEEMHELLGVFRDLADRKVDILTIGQYLRPSRDHLPMSRFYTPDEFAFLRHEALAMGFRHVESASCLRKANSSGV